MSSNTLLQRIVAIAICMVFLASCAGVPKRAMDGETRRLLVSVAIVEPSNPDQYMVLGASDVPGGFMLYAFGAIGGAVLGGIMASKMEEQARQLTSSLQPYQPQVGRALGDSLKAEFEARGIKVTMIPAPPRDKEKKYDYTGVSVQEQVIIEPIVTLAGYRLNSGVLKPMLGARVRVLDAESKQERFLDIFLYGDKMGDRFVTIEPDASVAYPDLTKLYGNGEAASNALRIGAGAIAKSAAVAIKG